MPQNSSNPFRRQIPPQRLKQLLDEIDAPRQAPVAEPKPSEPGMVAKYGPTGIRALGAFLGVTPLKAGGIGAIAETAAQGLEKLTGQRESFSPRQIGLSGLIGGLGGGAVQAITKNISRPVQAALRAAPWAAAQPVVRSVAEEGELPSVGEVATNVGLTSGLGYGFGKLAQKLGMPKLGYPANAARPTTPEGPQTLENFLRGKSGKDIENFALRQQATGMPQVAEDVRRIATEGGKAAPVSMSRLIAQRAAEAKAAAKEAADEAAAAKISEARQGLVKKEQVSETLKAPIKGGTEQLRTVFSKPRPKRTGRVMDLPPEGNPVRNIYEEWIQAGRKPETALKLAIAGRKRLATAPGSVAEAGIVPEAAAIPEVPQLPRPRTPEEVEAYLASKAAFAPEAPAAPVSPLEDLLRAEPQTLPEVTPAGIVGTREASLGQAQESTNILDEIQALSGGSGARAAAEAMPPAGVPDLPQAPSVQVPEEISAFQRLLKGEALPEGPLKAPSAKGAEAIAKAQERFSPEANTRLDALRRALNFTPARGEERGLIANAMREIQGKELGLPEVVVQQPLGPKAPPRVRNPRLGPASKINEIGAQQGVADEAERLLAEGMDPDQAIVQAKQSFMDRLKKLGGEGGGAGGGEAGAIDPALLYRLGTGAAGAAAGAVFDPLDDPISSAVAGGVVGLAIPTLVQKLGPVISNTPGVNPEVSDIIGAAATREGMSSMVKNIANALPHALRANLLTSPNLLNNAITGPWGSMVTVGMELHLAGDPRGMKLIEAANPITWADEFTRSWTEAASRIGRAEGEALAHATGPLGKSLAFPGTIMTMGDVTSRNLAMRLAGLSDDEAMRMTLTAEPEYLQAIVNFQRTLPGGHIFLPFARTVTNIVERGLERTPLVGSLFQGLRKNPDPFRVQAAQQILGASAAGGGYAAGVYDPTEGVPAGKFYRSAITNVAGPYSLLAGAGFAAGKAHAGGATPRKAALTGAGEALQTLPLPTTDVPESYARALFAEPGQRKLPTGLLPTIIRQVYEGEYRPDVEPRNVPGYELYRLLNPAASSGSRERPNRRRPRGSR